MAEIRFRLNVIPRGQARARHAGHSRAYKTEDQQADERTLEALLAPYVPERPLQGMLSLLIEAMMPIPKSFSLKKVESALSRTLRPTTKPDLSNVLKHVEDVMQRMRFFEDDKQIVDLYVCKVYGDSPGYRIMLREIGGDDGH